MHFLQAINSDLSVLIVCNKTGGTIKGDKKTAVFSDWKHTLINVQRDATICSLYFILLQCHSTCFGCLSHPSSGVHKTVVTATAATSIQRGQVGHVGLR